VNSRAESRSGPAPIFSVGRELEFLLSKDGKSASISPVPMNASFSRRTPPFFKDLFGACEKFHKFGLRVCGRIRTLRDNVRSMPATALSLSLVLGFSACGPRLADRNIDAVNRLYEQAEKSGKSLSIKEVEAVLGQPNRMESFPIEMQTTKELPGVRYYYKQDGRTIELHFVDNKLIRRVDHFGETPAPEDSERHMMPHHAAAPEKTTPLPNIAEPSAAAPAAPAPASPTQSN
jgi:hypothetical protein